MSKLSERCEQRKAEAEALADKFNAVKAEIDKLRNEANQKEKENIEMTYEQFKAAKYKYDELAELVKEEEGVSQTTTEVVE
tara:strand:- start:91 stop:333 length:243 start_codon:yes stop_codon:yes gene_type:complete